MGQKVNPHGMRVGVIKDWDSRWYASNEKVGDLLVEDHKIRVYLKKLLFAAGVSKIEIERSNEVVTIYLHVARPGVVIGKGGEQIEQYRKDVEKLIGNEADDTGGQGVPYRAQQHRQVFRSSRHVGEGELPGARREGEVGDHRQRDDGEDDHPDGVGGGKRLSSH